MLIFVKICAKILKEKMLKIQTFHLCQTIYEHGYDSTKIFFNANFCFFIFWNNLFIFFNVVFVFMYFHVNSLNKVSLFLFKFNILK